MKPDNALRLIVDSDFSMAAFECALDILNRHVKEEGIALLSDTKYVEIGMECDLLEAVDLCRLFGFRLSFKKDYEPDEWSISVIRKDDLRHVTVWSPGA